MTPILTVPAVLLEHRLIVVDVEGNGQNPPEIIELAALPVHECATETDLRSWLIRPQQPITPLVTRKVHGIDNAAVADSPTWSEVSDEIAGVLADRTLVAHNASVEHRVLAAHLPAWTPPMVLDTLRLAKHVWPGLDGGYGLDRLIVHADIDAGNFAEDGHHRAGYDTWCTWQLLCRLVEAGQLDWNSLLAAAALPGMLRQEEPDGLW